MGLCLHSPVVPTHTKPHSAMAHVPSGAPPALHVRPVTLMGTARACWKGKGYFSLCLAV